jgi:hypothetical protein
MNGLFGDVSGLNAEPTTSPFTSGMASGAAAAPVSGWGVSATLPARFSDPLGAATNPTPGGAPAPNPTRDAIAQTLTQTQPGAAAVAPASPATPFTPAATQAPASFTPGTGTPDRVNSIRGLLSPGMANRPMSAPGTNYIDSGTGGGDMSPEQSARIREMAQSKIGQPAMGPMNSQADIDAINNMPRWRPGIDAAPVDGAGK